MTQASDDAPAFAVDQRTTILQLLRAAGPAGVNKAHLVFERHFTQASARIWELEKQGYKIRHESRDDSRYVYFVLISEPDEPQPQTTNWYEETTGKPRATALAPTKPEQQPTQGTFALCDALERQP